MRCRRRRSWWSTAFSRTPINWRGPSNRADPRRPETDDDVHSSCAGVRLCVACAGCTGSDQARGHGALPVRVERERRGDRGGLDRGVRVGGRPACTKSFHRSDDPDQQRAAGRPEVRDDPGENRRPVADGDVGGADDRGRSARDVVHASCSREFRRGAGGIADPVRERAGDRIGSCGRRHADALCGAGDHRSGGGEGHPQGTGAEPERIEADGGPAPEVRQGRAADGPGGRTKLGQPALRPARVRPGGGTAPHGPALDPDRGH